MEHLLKQIMPQKDKLFKVAFRYLEIKNNLHIAEVEKIEPNFCMIRPIAINISIPDKDVFLLFDGSYIIDLTNWSGVGLGFSKEFKPKQSILDSLHKWLADN